MDDYDFSEDVIPLAQEQEDCHLGVGAVMPNDGSTDLIQALNFSQGHSSR